MKYTNLTNEEKSSLQEWVGEGNSPLENPWYMTGEDGKTLDYISALRAMYDLEEQQFKDHCAGLCAVNDSTKDETLLF